MADLKKRWKLLGCLTVALICCHAARSRADVTEAELRKFGVASIFPQGDEYETTEKYFVLWRGKPTAFGIKVEAGSCLSSNFNTDMPGIKVRVRAFDDKHQEVGQINGPGKQDDTFLTGKKCRFTPPKPGNYRLTVEVLDANSQVIPMRDSGYRNGRLVTFKTPSRAMNLLVFRPALPQLEISYSGWRETPEKPDVYERTLYYELKNLGQLIPQGYSYRLDRTDVPKWLYLKLRVVSRLPLKNLDQKALQQITWFSSGPFNVNLFMTYASLGTQYFHYVPTRDISRAPNFFTVKARIAGSGAQPEGK